MPFSYFGDRIIHINPARFLTGSFVRVVVVTILSMMLILQSVTLIFGPTIPNAAAACS